MENRTALPTENVTETPNDSPKSLLPLDVVITSNWIYPASIITAIGILGNFITMAIVAFDKRLHRPTFCAIGLLALSDFLCLILYVVQIILKAVHTDASDADLQYTLSLYYVTIHSSAGHVVLFWGVRLYLTAHPFKSKTLKITTTFIGSGIVWILSGVFGFVYYLIRFSPSVNEPVVILSFRGYLLFVPCIIIYILHRLKIKQLQRTLSSARLTSDRKRMSKIMTLILFIYMSSAILYPVSFILDYYTKYDDSDDIRFLIIMARMFWLINASCNPVIYFLFSPPIYRVLQRVKKKVSTSISIRSTSPRRPEVEIINVSEITTRESIKMS